MAGTSTAKAKATSPDPEPAPTPVHEHKYSVTIVMGGTPSGGDHTYSVMLTDAEIRTLLADNDSPHWIELPETAYRNAHPLGERRFVSTLFISEVHVMGWNAD